MTLVIEAAVFLLGLCVGSFLNVCIVRLPCKESVVLPRSHCRACGSLIHWYDNIPLLSYVWLRGRCRSCGKTVSLQYFMVELLTALLAVATLYKFQLTAAFFIYFLLLVAPLIVVTFIDLEHRIIPNLISLPGIVVGVISAIILNRHAMLPQLLGSLVGILVGGGGLFLVSWLYEKIRGQEGIGMGDIKLAAMFGAFFGWQGVLSILLFSSFLGSFVGVMMIVFFNKGFRQAIPFGPFLAGGALIYLYYGPELLAWYLTRLSVLR